MQAPGDQDRQSFCPSCGASGGASEEQCFTCHATIPSHLRNLSRDEHLEASYRWQEERSLIPIYGDNEFIRRQVDEHVRLKLNLAKGAISFDSYKAGIERLAQERKAYINRPKSGCAAAWLMAMIIIAGIAATLEWTG